MDPDHSTSRDMAFLKSDPARWGFQYLEDMATGYWYSQVLFSAVELDLFGWLETGCATSADLAAAAGCHPSELSRLLTVLVRLEQIHATPGGLVNSQLAGRFLVPGRPDYMGDFILYRRYMQAGWSSLTQAVARPKRPADPEALTAGSDYAVRNFHYVRAMDGLARLKAREITADLNPDAISGPILDVGGGAGALCRELVRSKDAFGQPVTATLFDLPEVIQAARRLYPQAEAWRNIETVEGDFRYHDFGQAPSFGLVVLSNFLHAYGAETARELLGKAVSLTGPNGVLLIHDYFPDRTGRRPHKGSLYDLNMLLNTSDGGCQPSTILRKWLSAAGMPYSFVLDLASDSSLLPAGRTERVRALIPAENQNRAMLDRWPAAAREMGFCQAELIRTNQIRAAVWCREKCRFGCASFGRNRMCPPDGIDHAKMAKMLTEYGWALLVIGTPPGKSFHDQLLALERRAFLAGMHKALAFGAGPCPLCGQCPADGSCRHPDRARPSMEGSGIDVYETARQAGLRLEPVIEPGRYVKYVGMVLLA